MTRRVLPLAVASILAVVAAPTQAQDGASVADPGWAREAGTLGIVAGSVIGGMLLTGLLVDDADTQIALGASAAAIGLITVPIVAAGSASARRTHADIVGSPTTRLVAWIGYGVFGVVGVAAVIAAAAGEVVGPELAVPVVLLGISVELSFAFDARAAASQAIELQGS